MEKESLKSLRLTLANDEGVGRLITPLEPYLAFDLEITQNLKHLVNRWSDLAAPRATSGGRLGCQLPRK